jgi:hypothetical protein
LKNVKSLIYYDFSKMRLPKSAILVYAAILSFINKNSSMIFFYIDP